MTQVEKFEFCSPAWVARAEGILIELADEAGDTLAGQRFSLCEVFTYAPPHLRDALARVSWHFMLNDGRIEACVGDNPDADIRIEVDYETAARYARIVLPTPAPATPPPDTLRISGDLSAMAPAVARFLAPLHNRLAVITA